MMTRIGGPQGVSELGGLGRVDELRPGHAEVHLGGLQARMPEEGLDGRKWHPGETKPLA